MISRPSPRGPCRATPLGTALTLVSSLAVTACGADDSDADPGGLQLTREMVDGIVVVTIGAGSEWGAPATAVEERAIGALEGADELMFGGIHDMAPDALGGVYVFDGVIRELRYFDAEGNFVRKLGREGDGPGEYGDAVLGMFVRSDGRLVFRDARNARLNVYEADGEISETWPMQANLFTGQAMMPTQDDEMYIRIMTGRPEPNVPWPIAALRISSSGEPLDTIPSPPVEREESGLDGFLKWRKHWTIGSTGEVIVGTSDRYSFEIRHRDGTTTRVIKDWTPVPVLGPEKSEYEALSEWQQERNNFSDFEPVPDTKPAYRGIQAGADGTIWIQKHVLAEEGPPGAVPDIPDPPPVRRYREPAVYDVFKPDGTYLGEVGLPPRTRVLYFSRDVLWGVRVGEFDEQYVVRLRVQRGEAP